MKNIIKFFTGLIMVIFIYGPTSPSLGYMYKPELPDEMRKLRKKNNK